MDIRIGSKPGCSDDRVIQQSVVEIDKTLTHAVADMG